MEKHLQQTPQSGRMKRAPGIRIGVAASAAVLIAVLLGVSSQKQVQAANFFFPIRGDGKPGAIAKFIDPFTITNSVISESLGNIGIGTGAPQAKLDVLGSVRIEGAGNGLVFADGSIVHNRAELVRPEYVIAVEGRVALFQGVEAGLQGHVASFRRCNRSCHPRLRGRPMRAIVTVLTWSRHRDVQRPCRTPQVQYQESVSRSGSAVLCSRDAD